MKIKLSLYAFFTLIFACAGTAVAQMPRAALQGLWRAQWITTPGGTQRDAAVLHFRKAIDLSQPPQRFMVQVSADSRFILSVNQREVGRGPARGDLEHWRYSTYDLGPFLHPGRNEIAATVWSYGTTTAGQISDRTAFVLRGETDAENVVDTNNTWEVAEEKGIQLLPTPADLQRTYFVAEPAMRIDGAVFDWSQIVRAANGKRQLRLEMQVHVAPFYRTTIGNWFLTPCLRWRWKQLRLER